MITDEQIIRYLENSKTEFHQATFDLIKRIKAENESLESRIFALNDTNRLLMDSQEIYWKNKVEEFAKRLKIGVPQETGVIRCAEVDNLVKEMTERGENNES